MECNLCGERKLGSGPVPGSGNKSLARICLLGRNPGIEEDRKGEPFVGRAGRKLNEGLLRAGIVRNECYITNVAKCFTPKDVKPSARCLKTCARQWLDDELGGILHLELVVTLGNEALKYFKPREKVGDLHGISFDTTAPWGREIKIFVSYHPSAALRSTSISKLFMQDMERLRNE